MKATVIGPGAIGSLIGGLLLAKNHNVSFVPNPESAHREDGGYLRLILPDRWIKIEHLVTGPGTGSDICIFSLKRTQYASLGNDIAKKLATGNHGQAVFLNCDEDDIKHLVHGNMEHSMALTLLNSVSLQPQDVELTTPDSFIVFEKKKFFKDLFSQLKEFGIKSFPVESIIPHANSLFLFELLFLPVAMCNTTLGYFLSFREGRELSLRILGEGIKTFSRIEKPLAKLPAMDPVDLLTRLEKKPEKFESMRNKCDRSYNTVLQSFLLNKKNEISRLNGKLITLARSAGVDPAWNWKLLQKVSRVLKLGFYPNPKELLGGIE